ncbi:hypothetical protein MROS_2805 [Melioribacter roseus P3M-2]|jgi:hypothetical protein|uniref:YdhG-like domain-containing protein n=1 Tax=Melioribacter roseus (strain DSM 23840 / JCM 17771 / VKM B-2668 / P3M-2) TaxID=1191523 RepID=I6ZA70_MELRP|nr:DUF1801 domain-containing protein [Melioribacter roseus]AFN76035.1 hypothetical protein MROS_2805 [Melioribacter roseus P3M-2]
MSELKTKPNKKSVKEFLNSITDENKKNDCRELAKLMEELSGDKPVMWGDSIVGFGKYHYVYKTGREGDWFRIGFSPRKQNIAVYLMPCIEEKKLEGLGKYKNGKSCLYIKNLSDVNLNILKKVLKRALRLTEHYV